MENKKLTPQELAYYLKGFFEVVGARTLNDGETRRIREMVESVDTERIHYDPAFVQAPFSPTVPVSPYVNVTTPGAPDWHLPTNISYNYNNN